MPIKVAIVPVTPYQQNCSIIKCEASGRAAIVDPGGDVDNILNAVRQMDAEVEKILLTHGHMDHCAASDVLRQRLEIPIEGPQREDNFWIEKLPESSIRDKLFPLGDDITFIPGHGPTSTFGQERLTNPFVSDQQYG